MPQPRDENPAFPPVVKKLIYAIIAIVVGLIVIFGTFYTIESGQEGVLLTFGEARAEAIGPGLHLKVPLVQRVVKFDMRTQKYGFDAATAQETGEVTLESAASSDLQIVKVRLAVNYRLVEGTAPKVWTTVGPAYEWTVIQPSVREATKAAVAQFKAADLINERETVRNEVEKLLSAKLAPYNIVVEQVSITDFDFSEQFNQAIEAKVTAEQQRMKAENDLLRIKVEAEQMAAQAKGRKDAQIAEAEGNSQATLLNAQADAEKVRLINEQLERSPQYIKYIQASRWNGAYPTFYMAGGSDAPNLLLQVPTE